jgi:uncharacterized protein YqfA (UPF0365 family)
VHASLPLTLAAIEWPQIIGIAAVLVLVLIVLVLSFNDLIGMRFRKTNLQLIVRSAIRANKAGLEVSTSTLETHHLAGGELSDVATAAILDHRHSGEDRFDLWCVIDLAGYDVVDAAQKAVEGKLMFDNWSIEKLQKTGVKRRYN